MANQYTTVQRVWDFIGEENFIADITYNQKKKCFRLVMRWHGGQDYLTYIMPSVIGGQTFFETYRGISDYNPSWNHKGAHFDALELTVIDISDRSILNFIKHLLVTYGRRYTMPVYFNQDGSTKCKYTQEQLESGRCF